MKQATPEVCSNNVRVIDSCIKNMALSSDTACHEEDAVQFPHKTWIFFAPKIERSSPLPKKSYLWIQ